MNKIYYGDNLEIMKKYIKDDSIDLIYLDPPFNSNKAYNIIYKDPTGKSSEAQVKAFDDTWSWTEDIQSAYNLLITDSSLNPIISSTIKAFYDMVGKTSLMSYIVMMTIRLMEMKRVLKHTGSIYLHCDPTASHYLKIIMDNIFGTENFQNEIVWCYRTGGATKRRFSRKHDVLLFYSKNKDFFFKCNKDREYYDKAFFSPKMDSEGRYYADVLPVDWWIIPAVINVSKERTGYPTQKPEKLLEKIIKASCPKDGIVLDPFCGCATTLTIAEKLNRRWIGIDITYLAINVLKQRFRNEFPYTNENETFEIIGAPKSLYATQKLFEQNSHQFAIWAITKIKGKPNPKKSGDKGVDGYYDFFDGGNAKRAIIQVKGGHTGPSAIRDFCHTVKREKAVAGIFISMQEPTKAMKEEAVGEGHYTDSFQAMYPKIQFLTIEEILKNKRINLPLTVIKNE